MVYSWSPSSRRAWIEIALSMMFWSSASVALLAEGVDRNTKSFEEHGFVIGSPSSRRAWIEMATLSSRSVKMVMVALLAEGVDRNEDDGKVTIVQKLSPSSRRAWIEIL